MDFSSIGVELHVLAVEQGMGVSSADDAEEQGPVLVLRVKLSKFKSSSILVWSDCLTSQI